MVSDMDRSVSETNVELVLIYSIDNHGSPGLFQNANEAACRVLGLGHAVLLNLSPLDLICGPDGRKEFLLYINNIRTAEARLLQTCLMAKDGSRIMVELKTRTFDINGQSGRLSIGRRI